MVQNPLAIASVSLGQHAAHTLPQKVIAAAKAGFKGIEVTYPDLDSYATSISVPILEAAEKIRELSLEHKLTVLAFASFQNYEGSKIPLSERLQTARTWLDIAHALGALHLQVPSNYDRSSSGDQDTIISELRQLGSMAAKYEPQIRIAYENLGWGTHCDLWQQAAEIVIRVDMENFGLCLDSFHFCVKLWADAYSKDGRRTDGTAALQQSLQQLVRDLPLDKLFYLQLSDGEMLDPPYSENHPWYDPTLQPGHVWSNEARPFPLEIDLGAYMPVTEIARAFLVDLGFTGWVSLETFDRRMRKEQQGPDLNAARAVKSWEELSAELDGSR